MRPRQNEPLKGFGLVLRHALSLAIADTQIVLSLGIILFSGLASPFYCFRFILRHAQAKAVARGQNILSLGDIFLGCFTKPLYRLNIVFRHAFTIVVTDAEIILSLAGSYFKQGSAVPSRKEIQWSQLKVGALVLVAVGVLVGLIFLMSGSTGGLFAPKLILRSYFDNARA